MRVSPWFTSILVPLHTRALVESGNAFVFRSFVHDNGRKRIIPVLVL